MKSKKLSKFIAGVMSIVMTFCCVFVPAFAADCDHMGNNFIYRDNGNGTHNVVEELAEIIGDNFDAEGNSILSFYPVFDKINNPDNSGSGDSGNSTAGRANVNTGVL